MPQLLALISSNPENLENIFRKVFTDTRASGHKKIIINVVSNIPYHELVSYVREAILDNIDIGYELYLWNKDDTSKILNLLSKNSFDGVLLYCDNENKSTVERIFETFPNQLKASLIKDYCRR
ncbi:MAG: DUF5751 family protein [Sulfolobaceae archaeon]|jgi:hypothetical protein|nr:DUF5751 family protein [Sulfolobaceae archaeon]